jgi:alpha-1,6-mannosyltransferase
VATSLPATRRPRADLAAATVGVLALAALLVFTLLIALGAAAGQSGVVPAGAAAHSFPSWVAGPLHTLAGHSLSRFQLQTLLVEQSGCFLIALAAARFLPLWVLATAVVLAHVIVGLAPILLSQDAFGYLDFARLGVLHGLNPYAHGANAFPSDPLFPYVGWHGALSPYGPLFTLLTYALVPLGVTGGMWALKSLAVLTSLATVALCVRGAEKLGHSGRIAAAFVGLNPILLTFAVGGAHNDTLVILVLTAATLATLAGRPARAAAMVVLAAGVKASAGVLLPFVLLARESRAHRREALIAAGVTLVLIAIAALLGFAGHALGFITALREQKPARQTIPGELARVVGLSGIPTWWQVLFEVGFVAVLIYCAWRVTRGTDWLLASGWATFALLLSLSSLRSWYAIWLLPPAAITGNRKLAAAALAMSTWAMLVHLPFTRFVL